MRTSIKSDLFKKKISISFLKFLENLKIDYCYLGNLSHFPSKISSDIDIFIDFKNRNDLNKILLKFSKDKKLKIANLIQHEFNSFTVIFSSSNKNNIEFISFDICNEYVINSRKLINLKKIKKRFIKKKNFSFKVLPKEYEFYYYLLKKISKNDINTSSFLYLKNVFNSIRNLESTNFFSLQDFNLLKKIFKSKTINSFNKYRHHFKKKLIDSKKKFFFKELMRYYYRITFKTGLHIVFLGCDGSGKTTQINLLVKSNIVNLFRTYSIYHLFSETSSENKKPHIPYRFESYGLTLSFIKILYLYFSFFFNYFIKLYSKLISSELVINDRYYHDVIIDPRRYRISFFKLFLNYIFGLLPKPDLIVILDADYRSLSKRKNESNILNIKNLASKYKKFGRKYKNCHVIKSNNNIKKTNKKIMNLIFDNKTIFNGKIIKKY